MQIVVFRKGLWRRKKGLQGSKRAIYNKFLLTEIFCLKRKFANIQEGLKGGLLEPKKKTACKSQEIPEIY